MICLSVLRHKPTGECVPIDNADLLRTEQTKTEVCFPGVTDENSNFSQDCLATAGILGKCLKREWRTRAELPYGMRLVGERIILKMIMSG